MYNDENKNIKMYKFTVNMNKFAMIISSTGAQILPGPPMGGEDMSTYISTAGLGTSNALSH